ncbi:unnamed protein product [Camellia sinensis]
MKRATKRKRRKKSAVGREETTTQVPEREERQTAPERKRRKKSEADKDEERTKRQKPAGRTLSPLPPLNQGGVDYIITTSHFVSLGMLNALCQLVLPTYTFVSLNVVNFGNLRVGDLCPVEANDAVTGHIISTTIGGKNGKPKQQCITISNAMDLKSFKLDIDELISEFTENNLTTLADMKRVWLSRKFSFIFEASPSTNLAIFMQSLYSHSIGYMVSTASLSHRLGGLYCLYCLHEVQPFKPPFKIYLSLGELKRLRNLVIDVKEKGIKVASALVKKMLERNVFLFGFVDINDGSVTERVNELTDIQNARVQVAHKKLFSNTRIENFIHTDLGMELDVHVLKKMSTDYAVAKELAIKEASELVDVQNIKHIAENKKLIGEMVEKTAQDWNTQKESFYQQTGLNQAAGEGPQLSKDKENFEQQDDVNFEQEDNEHFGQEKDGENIEQPEDDEKFGDELERQMLYGEEL